MSEHCWDDLLTDQDRRVYEAYERVRRFGRSPALLLIDLYNRVFGDGPAPLSEALERWPGSCGLAAWDALDPLTRLLSEARTSGVPVVHTTRDHRLQRHLGRSTKRTPVPEDADWGSEIVAPLAPSEDELVVRKVRPSAFFGTTLETYLRRAGIDTLVVGGETTSGCVRATVVDAHSHGFEVVVVEEATFDRIELSHKVNLFDLHHKYATVVHVEDALEYLTSAAGAR